MTRSFSVVYYILSFSLSIITFPNIKMSVTDKNHFIYTYLYIGLSMNIYHYNTLFETLWKNLYPTIFYIHMGVCMFRRVSLNVSLNVLENFALSARTVFLVPTNLFLIRFKSFTVHCNSL